MLLKQLDMCCALDMFASQTRDLYHIETDRKGGYIEFAKGKYIEQSSARHIDKKQEQG